MTTQEDRRVYLLEASLRKACAQCFPPGWGEAALHVVRWGIRTNGNPGNVQSIAAMCQDGRGRLPTYPSREDLARLMEAISAVWL